MLSLSVCPNVIYCILTNIIGSGSLTLWCTVSHKPLFGDSLQTIIPPKNLDHLSLRHLQCGKHYDVSVVCFNGQGPSRVSDVLRDVRTLGQKPVVPRRPTDFVHPTNVSVRLDLFMWNDENCPVDYFVVSYKRTQVRCLYVSLSVYFSVSLTISLYHSLSVYLTVCLSNFSVWFDLFMWNDENCPVDYFVVSYKRTQVRCFFVYLSVYFSVSLNISMFISMYVYLSVYQYVYLYVCLPLCLIQV